MCSKIVRNNSNLVSYSIPFLTGILMCSQFYVYNIIKKNRKYDNHYYLNHYNN